VRRRLVVDASVAAKWLLPEPGSDAASALLEGDDVELHAPELWTAELTNVLCKHCRRGELTPAEAAAGVQQMLDMPVTHHEHEPLAAAALVTALTHGISVYDALYVDLARGLDATLITADERLVRAGDGDGVWPVRLLGGR
jgi:predicted nucleic acid-binding protein